jgi:heterodisulfide reductase subunit A-like polyferredoxin
VKVKTLVCNCKGLDPFRFADMNTLAFEIESELDVAYAAVHPQLCEKGGNAVLEDVLRSAEDDPDTYVMVCACAEETQKKLFKEALHSTGIDEKHFVAVDARNTTNDGILERIRARLAELAGPSKPRH